MTEYLLDATEREHIKKENFQAVLDVFEAYESFWLVSHVRPDPDAVGCLLALGRVLRQRGKRGEMLLEDEPPRITHYLPDVDQIRSEPTLEEAEVLVVLDVASRARIGKNLAERLHPTQKTVNIDHHVTGARFADVQCIHPDACATCEILFDLFEYAGESIDRETAECLYAGIIGDTGNFRFSNTTPRTHLVAAELIRLGVAPQTAYEHIYDTRTEGQVRLLGKVLETLRRTEDGRIASIRVTQAMYRETGTSMEDVDGFTDYPRSVEGVWAVAFFCELPDGQIKVSLRSRHKDVTVDGIAAMFGGGGHAYAAGCELDVSIDEAEKRVVAALMHVVEKVEAAGG